jgi:hypothetical protein
MERYGVLSIVELLVNNSAKGEIGCVGVHVEQFCLIWGS